MLTPLFKSIHLLLLGLAFLSGLACLKRQEDPISLATSRRTAQEPLHLARQMGVLDEREIRLVEMPGSVDCMRALKSGLVQGAALTLEEACSLIQEDDTFQLALVMGASNGADALVSRQKIKNLAQLKGLRIGVDREMVFSQLLGRCLEKAGLKIHEVRLVRLAVAKQEKAFETGEVDALVCTDPQRTRLQALGGEVVFDSREIPGEVVDVLVVKKNIAIHQRQRMNHLRLAWFKALEHISRRPDEAFKLVTERIPMDSEVVQLFFQRIDFPDPSMEKRLRAGGLKDAMQSISRRMLQQRILKKEIETKPFWDEGESP